MQKNNLSFALLALSSDLRNVSTAMIASDQSQATIFFAHAIRLIKSLPLQLKQIVSMTDDVPKDGIERIKKADKLITWSNIVQEMSREPYIDKQLL